ncbi:hypothetical protein PoB_004361400 [Plakobranchus ocellatus]|uniref:Uncharacterized protein n=1 Tax=Plakobranchus ocellatus TaxID=259542 RepID=A0AAV4BE50_9GAST|nr:hypothetical protein PoB_004361400 [Plakobranchus ocellatus]
MKHFECAKSDANSTAATSTATLIPRLKIVHDNDLYGSFCSLPNTCVDDAYKGSEINTTCTNDPHPKEQRRGRHENFDSSDNSHLCENDSRV